MSSSVVPAQAGFTGSNDGPPTIPEPTECYKEAAFTFFRCRRTGVTIRSAADRLIARVTIEQDLVLPQDDQTFQNVACVVPELAHASAGFYLSAPSGVKCRYEAR